MSHAPTNPRTPSEGLVTLVCIECGLDFDSSARYARAIRRGLFPSRCKMCRRTAERRPATAAERERYRRFWLERFGASLNGQTSAEYVGEHGLPGELREIVRGISSWLDLLGARERGRTSPDMPRAARRGRPRVRAVAANRIALVGVFA